MSSRSIEHALADDLDEALVFRGSEPTAPPQEAPHASPGIDEAAPVSALLTGETAVSPLAVQLEEDAGPDDDVVAAALSDGDVDVIADEAVDLGDSVLELETAADRDVEEQLLTNIVDRTERRSLRARVRAGCLPSRFRDFVL